MNSIRQEPDSALQTTMHMRCSERFVMQSVSIMTRSVTGIKLLSVA